MSRKSRLSRVTPTRPTNRNRHERFLSAFLGEAAGNPTLRARADGDFYSPGAGACGRGFPLLAVERAVDST